MNPPARMLGLAVAALFPSIAQAQEVSQLFQQGVDLLQRGQKTEALAVFQQILAADPSQEEAYELWKDTDYDIWLDLMIAGEQFDLVAQRLQTLSRLSMGERSRDEAAISEKVATLGSTTDPIERHRAIQELASEHGEYAVPLMVRALADEGDDDRRVIFTHALSQMGSEVVPALTAALGTESTFQRRNTAALLGLIGDPRAAGFLGALAESEGDESVGSAARKAAERCGLESDALADLLRQGDDYHHRRGNVLRPMDYSDVIWSWEDGQLTSRDVPREIYNDEMALKAYWAALGLDPASLDARAGIARAVVDRSAKLERLEARGEDLGELAGQAQEGVLAAYTSGVDALDQALQWSAFTDDTATGVALCKALGDVAVASTPGLEEALESGDGAIAGEAAVALGRIASLSGGEVSPRAVSVLGEAAGREIVRVAAVIDADSDRASLIRSALSAKGILVNHRGSGASGVAMLHHVPGLDVVLVGDSLPDLTLDAVLSDMAANPVTSEVATYLLTADEELSSAWGERFAGVIASPDDLSALDEVFDATLTGDRAQADELAQRAAAALADLARTGRTNLASALPQLAGTLASRPDEVTLPAMVALGIAGTAEQVPALSAVVTSDDRSDASRVGAANALAGIFGRVNVEASQAQGLGGVLSSDASIEVRRAVSKALGAMRMSPDERRTLLGQVHAQVDRDSGDDGEGADDDEPGDGEGDGDGEEDEAEVEGEE